MTEMLTKFLKKAAITDVETATIDETAQTPAPKGLSLLSALRRSPSEAPDIASALDLDTLSTAHDAHLDDVNQMIADSTCGGRLIAAPLCPSICNPGPLTDFIALLGLDPFQRWNMMYYADTEDSALALQTEVWDDSYVDDLDGPMCALIKAVQTLWLEFEQTNPSQEVRESTRISLRDQLVAECNSVETTLFGEGAHIWRQHFDSGYAPAA